ncbi:MAG: helix-turn-helix transcriptional regulator [Bacillota bacterium]
MNKLSENLTNLILENNMTQSDVAKIIGVKQNSISRWANGEREPSLDTLIKLSVIFNVSLNELLGLDDSLIKEIKNELNLITPNY